MTHMDIQQIHHLHELLVRSKPPSPYMKEPLPTLPEQTSATLVSDLLGPVDNTFLKTADGHMLLQQRQHMNEKQRASETDLLSYALLEPTEIERPYDDLHLQADQNQVYLQSLNSQITGGAVGHQGLPPRPYSMVPSSVPGVAVYPKDAAHDVQAAAANGMRVQVDPSRIIEHGSYIPRPGAAPQYTMPTVSNMPAPSMQVPRQFELWDKRPYDHQHRFVKAPHHPQQIQNHFVPAATVQGAHPPHIPRTSFPPPPVTARGAAARRIRRYSTGSIVAYPPSWADSTWHPLAMAVSSGQLANGGTGVFLPGGGSNDAAGASSTGNEEQALNKPRRNSVAEPLYRHLEEPSAGSSHRPEALPEEWLY